MPVRIPTLIAGEPEPVPVINFRLSQMADGVSLEAKHSEDRAWQTILEVGLTDWGQLEARMRDLYQPRLIEIASIEEGQGLRVIFKSMKEPGKNCVLAPSHG